MSIRVRLIYPDQLITVPVIGRLAQDFGILANIRRAAVDGDTGWIVCELEGRLDELPAALAWLEELGVDVEQLGDVVES